MGKIVIAVYMLIAVLLFSGHIIISSELFQLIDRESKADPEKSSVPASANSSSPSFEALTKAIIQTESDGRARLVGPCRERGLMQVPRRTWNWICRTQLKVKWDYDRYAFNPEKNIAVGQAELRYLLKRLNNDWEAAVMAYNCGLRRYRNGKIPKLTYRYLARVKQELGQNALP